VAALGIGAFVFSDLLAPSPRRRRTATGSGDEATTPVEVVTPPPERPRPAPRVEETPTPVTIDLEGGPEDLQVLVDGRPATLPLTFPRDGAVHKVTFRAHGYQPETRMIEASRSQTLTLDLKKEERAERPPRPPKPVKEKVPRPGPTKANVPDPIIDL
jgi:hypothetical protein